MLSRRYAFAVTAAVLAAIFGPTQPAFPMGGDTPPAASADQTEYDKAVAAVEDENYQTAARLLLDVVRQQPDNTDALNYLGFSLRKLHDYDRAIAFYQKALAVDPNHTGANEYLGEAYVELGRIDKAKERLAKLEALCGRDCDEYQELSKMITAYQAGQRPQQSSRRW